MLNEIFGDEMLSLSLNQIKTQAKKLTSAENLTPTMSPDGRVVIHLLRLKYGPPLDKESSREEIKLDERMASILKDFEARQLEVDEDEQLEVVEEEEKD
ncbi:unnamed protein product [Heligmosomoides polygyrus]|uniref:Ubiquitin-like domain-containing protein n=1 Tax=Heligmosomoides polygyrus TaxID=6339 RepID=A0A183F692_HELPZ|nr:unnamed protein product [Heligmosomoides polygyrus]